MTAGQNDQTKETPGGENLAATVRRMRRPQEAISATAQWDAFPNLTRTIR